MLTISPRQVLLESELRSLSANSSGQLSVRFLCSSPSSPTPQPPDVTEATSMRRLSGSDLLALAGVGEGEEADSMVLICGPDGFVKHAKQKLKEAGMPNVMSW